jgi:hypothetical protein
MISLSALVTAVVILSSMAAQAQYYGPGPSSAEPSNPYYGQQQQSWPQPSYQWQPVPSLPEPPQIEPYIPAPSQGPSGYPCTMPGCR